jgi:hypothetical protein
MWNSCAATYPIPTKAGNATAALQRAALSTDRKRVAHADRRRGKRRDLETLAAASNAPLGIGARFGNGCADDLEASVKQPPRELTSQYPRTPAAA